MDILHKEIPSGDSFFVQKVKNVLMEVKYFHSLISPYSLSSIL